MNKYYLRIRGMFHAIGPIEAHSKKEAIQSIKESHGFKVLEAWKTND